MKIKDFPEIKDLTNYFSWSGLSVCRDDQIHPRISGNKWRKLKYNIHFAKEQNINTLITFGGAFSNHIYATAAACQEFGIQSVGIIRGEEDKQNPTLNFAKECGMKLQYISRSDYQKKEESVVVKAIISHYPNSTLIPEGGSNALAFNGLHELAEMINNTDFDAVLVSAGTGFTAAGLLQKIEKEVHVFSALKGSFLETVIKENSPVEKHNLLYFYPDHHLGGYAKTNEQFIQFINEFYSMTDVPIDPIYNGKLVYAFKSLVEQNKINPDKKYLWLHTGGLQGIDAYNYMAKKKGRLLIASI